MGDFLDIIKGRQSPGILIFDLNQQLIYSNHEIVSLIPEINTLAGQGSDERSRIFTEILDLCDNVKKAFLPDACSDHGFENDTTCALLVNGGKHLVSMRGFMINGHGPLNNHGHIMILAEKIVEKRNIDFARIKKDYGFSGREIEVLQLVCAGMANKGIAKKLFISEYTVKDHLKNIMQKMGTSSRNEIMAALKS